MRRQWRNGPEPPFRLENAQAISGLRSGACRRHETLPLARIDRYKPPTLRARFDARPAALPEGTLTMAIERTFSIIKPDATARNLTGAINAMIEQAGLRIVAQKRVRITREQAETFYAVHRSGRSSASWSIS